MSGFSRITTLLLYVSLLGSVSTTTPRYWTAPPPINQAENHITSKNYINLLNTQILEVATHKEVTLQTGTSCASGSPCVELLSNRTDSGYLTTTGSGSCVSLPSCQSNSCIYDPGNRQPPPNNITSSVGVLPILISGQAIGRSSTTTYMIKIIGTPSNSTDGFFLTLTISTFSGSQQARLLFQYNNGDALLIFSIGSYQVTITRIKTQRAVLITLLSDSSLERFGLFIDGKLSFTRSGTITTLSMSAAPPTVFPFTIESWGVFDRSLTTREQLEYSFAPTSPVFYPSTGGDCDCTPLYPAFVFWPHTSKDWFGVQCQSLEDRKTLRLPQSSYTPQFITDGFTSTFWLSSDTSASKFTIDLGTRYHVLFAILTMETYPRHILISRKLNLNDPEANLLLATDDCTSFPNGFSPGTPYHCIPHDQTTINKNTVLLDWASSNPSVNTGTQLSRGEFLARYMTLHLKGHMEGANRHVVNEFKVYGACGCSNTSDCVINESASRRRRAAPIFPEVNLVPVQIYNPWRDRDLFGFNGCANGSLATALTTITTTPTTTTTTTSPTTTTTTPTTTTITTSPTTTTTTPTTTTILTTTIPLTNTPTITPITTSTTTPTTTVLAITTEAPCNCSIGASSNVCGSERRCICDVKGASKPELADRYCNVFAWNAYPGYGPVAGGTQIELLTGWFSESDRIILDGSPISCLVDRSAGSHFNSTGTSFYTNVTCDIPAHQAEGEYLIYINQQRTGLTFTYKPNPNITNITTPKVILSGGVGVNVHGTNLDSVAEPIMEIKIICRLTGEVVAKPSAGCEVKSSENMVCTTPNLGTILAEQSGCRFTTPNPDTVNGLRNRRALDDTAVNHVFVFHYGFVLDGVNDFENATEVPWLAETATLIVTPDPEIEEWPRDEELITRQPSDLVEVDGKDLNEGAVLADYRVEYGQDAICEVTALYQNKLACQLPAEEPQHKPGEYKNGPNDEKVPALVVSVGNLKSIRVGFVRFEKADPNLVFYIVLPTVAVVIMIVVIVAVVCFRKKNRTKKYRNGSSKFARYVSGPEGKKVVISMDESYLESDNMKALESKLIPHDQLALGKALGHGQFGKVFMGSLLLKSGQRKKVAVKTIKTELTLTDSEAFPNFLREAVLMKDFSHPNVLSLVGLVLTEDRIPMVILPFMSRGDLKKVLKDDKMTFTVGDLMHFVLQIATGMDYLQTRKFVHRDLAARNCMVNEDFFVKIADFGLSRDIYAKDYYRMKDKSKPLPVKWMALESLVSGKYTTESDVWSFGVVVWEVLTRGATPYPGVANYEIKNHLKIGQRLYQPDFCPDEVYDLMQGCWDLDPMSRPRFSEVVEVMTNFLSDDDDYARDQTKDIASDYYLNEEDEDDLPNFSADAPPPPQGNGNGNHSSDYYDAAMPFYMRPKGTSIRTMSGYLPMANLDKSEDYMQPSSSREDNPYVTPKDFNRGSDLNPSSHRQPILEPQRNKDPQNTDYSFAAPYQSVSDHGKINVAYDESSSVRLPRNGGDYMQQVNVKGMMKKFGQDSRDPRQARHHKGSPHHLKSRTNSNFHVTQL